MSLLSAFLVVALHCVFGADIRPGSGVWLFYTLFQEQFIRIAVPFFFAAAGFLLVGHADQTGWYKAAISSRVKTLVIPYCFFVLIHFVLLNTGKSIHEIDFSLLAWMERFGLLLRQPHPGILWFIRTLFLFVLISPLFVSFMSRDKMGGVILLVVMQAFHLILYKFWPSNESWKIFWDYLFFYRGLCFFATGIFLRFHPITFGKYQMFFIWGMTLCFSVLRVSLMLSGDSYNLYPLLVCFELPLWVASVWLMVPSYALPKWLTSCAFPVYLLHPYCLIFLQKLLARLSHVGIWNDYFIVYIGLAICTFCLSCIASIVIRRLCPRGAKWLFGGR